MKYVLLIAVFLSGCASTVGVEIDHVSHLTQHFGANPTDYGYDSANVVARFTRGSVYAELSEGLVLESRDGASYGGLWGPREIFGAKFGYTLWSSP